jgi:flagellar biosynthesis protein FlhF
MKPKTYIAQSLNEALAQVKKDLGPEAVILSTRSRRTFGPPDCRSRLGVEVKAAIDNKNLADIENFSPKISADAPQVKSLHQIQDDLRELKELFACWLQHQGPPTWLMPHEGVVVLYQELLKKGVARQILQRWLTQVQTLLAEPHKPLQAIRNNALALLMNAFEVVDPWQVSSRPRYWTFQGPTGVGKTTTIAKLAVHFTLALKKKVGLISLDASRPGAYEQLAIYAKLIEAPFAAVNSRQELWETISRWQDREIVLIDTPGQNPASADVRMNWSNLFVEMPQLQRCLVLSTTCSEANLAAAIEGFSTEPLYFAIITKVDESRNISGLFNQLCHRRLPVAYLTTGQRVPEDIEPATRQRIVELLLAHPPGTFFNTGVPPEKI